jgi:hypothetical protein
VSQEILDVEQVMDEAAGLELTDANVDTVLDEIRWVGERVAKGIVVSMLGLVVRLR